MFDPTNSLQRAAADACLHKHLGDGYGHLTIDQAPLVITAVIELANELGYTDLWKATVHLQTLLGPGGLAGALPRLQTYVDHRRAIRGA
jgi:hypothetical protein